MDDYLAQLKAAVQRKDSHGLSTLFDPAAASNSFYQLKHSLITGHSLRPTSYTNLARSFFPDFRPVADLVSSYLLYVRDVELQSLDPTAAATAYQLLEDCFKGADKVFAIPDSGWFVPTLRKFARALVDLALRAGRLSGDTNLTRAGEAATLFRRPMTIAASDRSTDTPSRRDALFFLANATFKVYFAMKNLRLCDTILNNTQNAAAMLETYNKADRVAFLYYRGRIWLHQRRLPLARQELSKALELCDQSNFHNCRQILLYLIVASLPLGIFPSEELLETFDLQEQFVDLLPALQLGDYVSVKAELDRWQEWHLQKGNYLILKEKLEVVCWRNLARRTLFVATSGIPLPADGSPPKISLHALLTTTRIAFEDLTLDLDDVECMIASLIEQGYIKGYMIHARRLVVFMKGPQVGFPPMSTVNAI
ncbi:COP9 signalosome complex subunit 12 [Meredithblackwellia eburnea MCA 4105]